MSGEPNNSRKKGLGQDQIKKLRYTKEPIVKDGTAAYPKQIHWLNEPTGFGVRIFPNGKKSYIFKYRNAYGQQRFATIGAADSMPLAEARMKAKKWDTRVDDGGDPLEEKHKDRKGRLMSDLCDEYLEKHAKQHKKSWKDDEQRNRIHIIPALGKKQVQHVVRKDVSDLHHKIGVVEEVLDHKKQRVIRTGKPYQANRVLEQLSKMFELAKTWGYVEETFVNPARGIEPFEEFERSEYIKPEHWPIVARAIENEPNEIAKCAIWMCIFTGKRISEILEAKWDDIDETAKTLKIAPGAIEAPAGVRKRKGSTKGGDVEYLPLTDETQAILERARNFQMVGNPYIFPSANAGRTQRQGTGHLVNYRKPWMRIQQEALANGATGIDKIVIHGLRHTFAVWLTNLTNADLGLVRKLLNHKSLLATKKYAKYKKDAVQIALSDFSRMVKRMSEPQEEGTTAEQ